MGCHCLLCSREHLRLISPSCSLRKHGADSQTTLLFFFAKSNLCCLGNFVSALSWWRLLPSDGWLFLTSFSCLSLSWSVWATITEHHRPSGLCTTYACFSQFERLEVWDQGNSTAWSFSSFLLELRQSTTLCEFLPYNRMNQLYAYTVAVVRSLSCVQIFATPWTAARQASLPLNISQSSPKFVSIESVMPSNHFIYTYIPSFLDFLPM